MSRIAKNPINITEGIDINISSEKFFAKGKHGEISILIPEGYKIIKENNLIRVEILKDSMKKDPNYGTIYSLVNNAIKGVSEGFHKTLELNGTGYRASISGQILKLQLGFSHDVNYEIPSGIKIECPKQNIIKLFSHDKELLGKVAAEIRNFRKPEPFKGKGIRYQNEYIFRKEGKKK